MRSTRLGALALAVLLTSLPAATVGPGARADTGPTKTNVAMKHEGSVRDGRGVVVVLARVEGDTALCTGRLRLRVRDLRPDEFVVDRSRPVAKRVRFRIHLEDGRHRLVATYELGDRDPCAVSRERRRITVHDPA